MINFSWDLLIGICFAAMSIYGFFSQKERLLVAVVSAYIALAVANAWGEGVYRFFLEKGDLLGSWSHHISFFGVTAALFGLFFILMILRGGFAVEERTGFYTPVLDAVLGFLTVGLVFSSVFSFMPDDARLSLIHLSKVSAFVWQYRTLWVVGPPLVLVFASFLRGRR